MRIRLWFLHIQNQCKISHKIDSKNFDFWAVSQIGQSTTDLSSCDHQITKEREEQTTTHSIPLFCVENSAVITRDSGSQRKGDCSTYVSLSSLDTPWKHDFYHNFYIFLRSFLTLFSDLLFSLVNYSFEVLSTLPL